LISKRLGHWSWTLSADERKTAAAVAIRQGEQTRLTTRLQRKHEAMLLKQRKLDNFEERLEREGLTLIGQSRARFRRSRTAPPGGNIFA
jgi:tmRNA-binding protein